MISLEGKFIKYIYRSLDNSFSVAIFKIDNNKNADYNLTNNLVISMQNIEIDINKNYSIQVVHSTNPKYKDGFELVSLEKPVIDSEKTAIDYLSSKKFTGITKTLAIKIINKLGYKFLNNPHDFQKQLEEITNEKKTKIIIDQIESGKIYHEILEKFVNNNLSMRVLYIIEKKYKERELLNFLTNDVYSILEQNENIGFFDVDNIAKIFLNTFSDEIRQERYILWTLMQLSFSEGSTIFNIKYIYILISKAFPISKDEFLLSVKRLIHKKMVINTKDKQSITPISIYEKELYIVQRLLEINKNKITNIIDNFNYSDIDTIQINALTHALNNPITIISGYPGTGKTTLVDKLVKNLNKYEPKTFNLLAPTGKAAYQIFLKTGHTARTIHSFLGMQKGSNFFRINKDNPSDVQTLIIDEFSMINIDLLYSLLIGCPDLKRLILIGDKNQLPSIGAGYLLNDFIESGKFKIFLLEKIYRQEIGSSIIQTALLINQQKKPIFNDNDSVFIEEKEKNAKYKILEKIDEFIENGVKLEEFQILVPMYAGECGIDQLNILIQKKYSSGKEFLEVKNNFYYIGDKVIQIENDNEANVFNGEIGFIKKFNKESTKKEIIVQFEDGKIIKYNIVNFMKNIKLAYAISIHKFQGSESKNIILVMYYSHYPLLSKKLLYTAVTRAVEKLIIFGEKKAIETCINKDDDSKRKGNILELLIEK